MKNLIDLHLHLDGALSIDNCRKLAKLQDITIPANGLMPLQLNAALGQQAKDELINIIQRSNNG